MFKKKCTFCTLTERWERGKSRRPHSWWRGGRSRWPNESRGSAGGRLSRFRPHWRCCSGPGTDRTVLTGSSWTKTGQGWWAQPVRLALRRRALIPPGCVRDDGQSSHKRGEEEEGDKDGLHLSRPACSARRLTILSQADLENSRA